MEAWLQGAALDAQVPALGVLLEGLSVAPAADVCALHVCVAATPTGEDAAPVELYMTRDLATPNSLWRVRHQARPMAGERAERLVAAVREVHEARTLSGNAFHLFGAMGFKMQYQVMHRGLRYTLLVGTQTVQVTVMVLEGQGEDGQPAPVVPGVWLLEASCKTTEETYQDAVAALAVVKQQLAAVVDLQRPALGGRRVGEPAGAPRPGGVRPS